MHPSASAIVEPLGLDVLTDIAAGLASTVDLVGSGGDSPPLVRQRLLATDGYDAWALHWASGAVADMHDHHGSVAVLHVVSGELVEVRQSLDGTQQTRVVYRSGDTGGSGGHEMHALANVGASSAVSVHVYSPPLGERR